MPWILNLAYVVLLLAVSPVLLYRAIVLGKYREGWKQKLLGLLPVRSSREPCLWFHAVSVGEVLQLQTIVRELEAKLPGHEFVITTTTTTGHVVATKQFPQHRVCYFPLDFSWSVRQAIRRVRPAAIVLVELELWPNFILAASRAGIPLILVNGRISEQSYHGYRQVRPLMKQLVQRFAGLLVQNETYAKRLVDLGAPKDRITITGSIKFDRIETDRGNPKTRELRESFGIRAGETVFIAGSTQAPEEEFALETWLTLRRDYPQLRLILVPRHKERFDEVARLVNDRRLPLIRRSRISTTCPRCGRGPEWGDPTGECAQPPVLLLDTLGELAACWGLADIAFVGGSLTNRGGQNMIEPAAYGAAVLFGPNTDNFRDVVEALLSRRAARVVTDQDD